MRAVVLAFLAVIGSIVLTVGSAFSAALASGAIGLLVPGTGTPNANGVSDYMANARDRYLQGTPCNDIDNCGTPLELPLGSDTLTGINYPASFWPLSFIPNWCRSGPDGCDKWDESVGKGTEKLTDELDYYLNHTSEDVVILGYSQGGAVVSNVLNEYIKNIDDPEAKKRIQIVTIGGIQTPDGGLWSRLGFLRYIPLFDITLTPPMTPDPVVKQTVYSFHFDPVGDAPRYWGNPFALLNAVAALETVHGYYLAPNGNGPTETLPYGYTEETLPEAIACNVGVNCRKDSYGNEYVVIAATSLPIADFIYGSVPSALRPLIKPLLELVAPAYRVLAELGYDYGGDPSVATPLSILPFNPFTLNPVKFAVQFVGAVGQGIQNALGGGTSLSPLNPPETATNDNVLAVQALGRLADDQSGAGAADLAPASATPVGPAVGGEPTGLIRRGAGQDIGDGATPLATVTQLPVTPQVVTTPVTAPLMAHPTASGASTGITIIDPGASATTGQQATEPGTTAIDQVKDGEQKKDGEEKKDADHKEDGHRTKDGNEKKDAAKNEVTDADANAAKDDGGDPANNRDANDSANKDAA